MGKPRLIILVRHAQSEGNKNRDIHQSIPDHRVKLTSDGWQQAYEAGRRLRAMLRTDDTLHFFTSPYRRTRETTEGILATLTADEAEPTPFKRSNIKVYEEPRLREQDFGNFQPCSAEMERMWQERADYGHFFYRIPNGESAADAYDRISGFNESLWRQFSEDDFASVCVLVTHGLMSRVFLMKWYHFSVEYFEDLRNVNHCEFLIMRRQDHTGKYTLENKLRTWSELRRERGLLAAREKAERSKDKDGDVKDGDSEDGDSKDGDVKDGDFKDGDFKDGAVRDGAVPGSATGSSKDGSKLDRIKSAIIPPPGVSTTTSPVEMHRRWGGCPDGCNHDKSFRIRSTMADLLKIDSKKAHQAAAVGDRSSGSGVSPSSSSSLTNGWSGSTPGSANANVASSPSSALSPGTTSIKSSFNGTANSNGTIANRRPAAKLLLSSASNRADDQASHQSPSTLTGTIGTSDVAQTHEAPLFMTTCAIDVEKAREEVVSSPDGTPSFISVEDRLRARLRSPDAPRPPPRPADRRLSLHLGRDFGGTYSGDNSVVTSDADSSEDDVRRRRHANVATGSSGGGSGGGTGLNSRLRNLNISDSDCEDHSPDAKAGLSSTKNSNNSANMIKNSGEWDRDREHRSRANRLGDYPHSSEGEHEADVEPDPEGECADYSHNHDSDYDATPGHDSDREDGQDLARTLTDAADHALLREKREETSVMGSVY